MNTMKYDTIIHVCVCVCVCVCLFVNRSRGQGNGFSYVWCGSDRNFPSLLLFKMKVRMSEGYDMRKGYGHTSEESIYSK